MPRKNENVKREHFRVWQTQQKEEEGEVRGE